MNGTHHSRKDEGGEFSPQVFEAYFVRSNLEVSSARNKLCQETWAQNTDLLQSLILKRNAVLQSFSDHGEALPLPMLQLPSDAPPAVGGLEDCPDGPTAGSTTDSSALPTSSTPTSSNSKDMDVQSATVERGNKHLAVVWGKTPPTRKYATFKIGDRKVIVPVTKMERQSAVRPCYRSWTTLKKNTYVEDDPVLRAIPYFGDNDMGRLDYIERGFEHILDEKEDSCIDPYRCGIRKVIFQCLTKFGKSEAVLSTVRRLLNQMETDNENRRSAARIGAGVDKAENNVSGEAGGSKGDGGELEESGSRDKNSAANSGVSEGCRKRKSGRGSKGGESKVEWDAETVLGEYEAAKKELETGRAATEDGSGKRSGMDSYRTLFCRRCYKYDCVAHGSWQPQPPPTPTPIHPHEDVDSVAAKLAGSAAAHKDAEAALPSDAAQTPMSPAAVAAACATAAAAATEAGLTERAWRAVSAAARVCGNDYEAIAAMCTSSDPSEPPLTPDDVRRALLRSGLLSSLVKRARSSTVARGKEVAAPAATGGQTVEGQPEPSTATLVWTCPCRFVCKGWPDTDAPANTEKRRKMQRSRMNSLTYRRWVKRDKNDGLQPEYTPCDCASKGWVCAPERCSCIDNGHFCEKFCGCSAECLNRFPGCQCRSEHKRCRTSSCPCYAAHRECDPDTCMCGAAHSPDGPRPCETCPPPPGTETGCGNLRLLQRNHATLRMAVSDVSGWGVFSTRALDKDEFVYEYMGEVVSHDEADRRGSIYDKFNHSFLFNLNSATVVDAGRKGNKTRFANHSSKANCYTRIMLVHGEHRIGVYAKEPIAAGDELFYDYRHEHAKYQGISAVPDWLRR